jgi:hypothetical protein
VILDTNLKFKLVNPKISHYATVNIQKAAYLCVNCEAVNVNNFNICIDCKSALAVVLCYYTCLISERSPVRFPAGRTKNFSLHTAAVTSPTA